VEYRNLTEKELALCTRAAMPGGLKLKDADMDLVEALHKKGLLYLEVPIRPDDHVSIPPLEVLCALKSLNKTLSACKALHRWLEGIQVGSCLQ
jgi:hypothetical protein